MQHCLTHRTRLRRKTGFRLRSRGEDAYASATFAYSPPRYVTLRLEDLTDLVRAEEKMEQSERKFALAMQSSPNGFAINRLSDGLYLEANRSESLMTGYCREELIGRSSLELNLWVDPEDRARFCRELDEKNTVSVFGAKLRRKSGEIREVLFFASLADIEGQRCILSEITDITDLKQMESALRRSHSELDRRVQERTAELTAANRKLEQQIRKRRTVESKLRLKEKQLKKRGDDLAESNAALRVLLRKREEDQGEIEEKIAAHLKQMVLPHVLKLQKLKLPGRAPVHLGALESNLMEIASPFAKVLSENLYHLTPTEMQVALLIKIDKSTKDIAAELHLSPKTVEFHRYNIRRKLGIGKKRLNLRSFLKTMT
jgi:PAS domain S-box-containing protein